eukprot:SAG22_NODE_505_length_9680_cov_10.482831_8_plen_231_part_00
MGRLLVQQPQKGARDSHAVGSTLWRLHAAAYLTLRPYQRRSGGLVASCRPPPSHPFHIVPSGWPLRVPTRDTNLDPEAVLPAECVVMTTVTASGPFFVAPRQAVGAAAPASRGTAVAAAATGSSCPTRTTAPTGALHPTPPRTTSTRRPEPVRLTSSDKTTPTSFVDDGLRERDLVEELLLRAVFPPDEGAGGAHQLGIGTYNKKKQRKRAGFDKTGVDGFRVRLSKLSL